MIDNVGMLMVLAKGIGEVLGENPDVDRSLLDSLTAVCQSIRDLQPTQPAGTVNYLDKVEQMFVAVGYWVAGNNPVANRRGLAGASTGTANAYDRLENRPIIPGVVVRGHVARIEAGDERARKEAGAALRRSPRRRRRSAEDDQPETSAAASGLAPAKRMRVENEAPAADGVASSSQAASTSNTEDNAAAEAGQEEEVGGSSHEEDEDPNPDNQGAPGIIQPAGINAMVDNPDDHGTHNEDALIDRMQCHECVRVVMNTVMSGRVVKAKTLFKCPHPLCPFEAKSPAGLNCHIRRSKDHDVGGLMPYRYRVCTDPSCLLVFDSQTAMQRHRDQHHR